MAKLTLVIDDDVLTRARIRAQEQGTSVDVLVREYIGSLAGESDAERGLLEFIESAASSEAGSGPDGRHWRRDDLYADRLRSGD
ncbi:MAG: DUF6364 family protein [Solirubrobacteraceae bacterium]|jgi:hypothetical protein